MQFVESRLNDKVQFITQSQKILKIKKFLRQSEVFYMTFIIIFFYINLIITCIYDIFSFLHMLV